MNTIPFYTSLLFGLITFVSVLLFYRASGKRKEILWVLFVAMSIETVLGLNGFFAKTDAVPPRLLLLLLTSILAIVILFTTQRGRKLIDGFDIKQLTLLHTIRILVEIVLFLLFLQKTVPGLMTFEGRNMDIVSGLTAPLIYYFVFVKKDQDRRLLFFWNIACLLILSFTVINAVLSAPTPFQRFGFDQPTVAVLYFPFVWLPGVVVPIVICSHLITIRKIWKEMRIAKTAAQLLESRVIKMPKG